jgi:hypothetical protein
MPCISLQLCLFFIKLVCSRYFVTVMKNWIIYHFYEKKAGWFPQDPTWHFAQVISDKTQSLWWRSHHRNRKSFLSHPSQRPINHPFSWFWAVQDLPGLLSMQTPHATEHLGCPHRSTHNSDSTGLMGRMFVSACTCWQIYKSPNCSQVTADHICSVSAGTQPLARNESF